jgi:hypothetical protein
MPALFDVQTYGAVGDGTTDDTAAIQSAIDATPANGGVVFFPPGTYKVVATLNIDKPLEILGSGPHATVVSSAHATNNAFETSYSLSGSGNAKVRPVIFRAFDSMRA